MTKLPTAIAVLAFSSTAALAAIGLSHNADPFFADLGESLKAARGVTGLNHDQPALARISAIAAVTAECVNPASDHSTPTFQDPADIGVAGAQIIPVRRIDDRGRSLMVVATQAPDPIIEGSPDCTNKHFIEQITDLRFKSATVAIEQPIGTTGFSLACTFTPATSDGRIPGNQVTCAQP